MGNTDRPMVMTINKHAGTVIPVAFEQKCECEFPIEEGGLTQNGWIYF
jgi:hypothetical protein